MAVEFLKIEIEIPSDVNYEMKSEVHKIIEENETEVVEIGKDFDVCIGSDSNRAKCVEIFNRIGVKSGDTFEIYLIHENPLIFYRKSIGILAAK